MVIVNPELNACIQEFQKSHVRHDFIKNPWLAQILTVPDKEGYLTIVWFKLDQTERWVKSGGGRHSKAHTDRIHKKTLMFVDFFLTDDQQIPEAVLTECMPMLVEISNKYKALCDTLHP